jgi:hypothetical protein
MNENIRNLALQAGFLEDRFGYVISPSREDITIQHELELFAYSIIEDCLEIMNEQMYNTSVRLLLGSPEKSSAIWDAKNQITKKYGIK